MAGSQKEFELLFRLKASLGSNFNSTFKGAIEQQKKLQDSLKNVNSLQGKVDGYNKASNAISQQNEKLARLQTEHQKTAQKIQTHQQNAERLRAKIEETGDATGELTAQLVREENEVQKNTEKLKRNESQIQRTRASIEQQEQQLESMSDELREAGVNTDNLEEANGRLQRSYERLQNSRQTIQRLNQAQQNINKSISHTKTQLAGTAGVMAAAGAAIYNGPVKKAAEFQEQMSTVKSLMGEVGKDELPAITKTADAMGLKFKEGSNESETAMNILAAKAKDMGATTKFTAKEAGDAMEFMAVAGWNAQEVLGGVVGIMNLAAAGGTELGQTSDIVTDSIENFGLTAADASHFADIMAQTMRKSNTDLLKLGESYKYVSPVAKAMGYSVEDINVALGLMANSGIKASSGGTALRTLLTNMAKPTDNMAAAMADLGVSLDDGNGNMKSFHDVMLDLRKGFGSLKIPEEEFQERLLSLNGALESGNITQKKYDKAIMGLMDKAYGAEGAIKAQTAATLAGKEGMSGLLAIVNASDETFNQLTYDINNAKGAAEEMAGTKLENFNGQITLLQSAWDALQVELGEMVLPMLAKAAKGITDVIGKVTDFVRANPEVVKTVAKAAAGFGAFRVAMLSLKLAGLIGAKGIVQILMNLLGLRIGFLESAAAGNRFAAKLLGLGAKLAGFGTEIKGIGTGVLAFMGKIAGALLGPFLRPFAVIGAKLGTLSAPIGSLLKTALGPLGGIAGKFLPIIGVITTIIAVVQILRKNFDKVREAVGNIFGEKGLEIFDKIVAVITNVGEKIKGVFSDGNIGAARDKINEIFGEKGVAVFDTFAGVFQKIVTAAGQFVDFVTTHIVPVVEQVFNVLITSVIPGIISGIQAAAPVVMQIFQAMADFIAGIIPVIGSFAAGLMPVISQIISFIQTNVLPVIGSVFNFIVSAVLPAIASGVQQLGSIITTVLSAVVPVVQTVFTAIWGIIQPIMQMILQVVQAVLPAVQAVFQSVFSALGGIVSAFQQVLSGIIQFITGVFTGNWSAAWNGIKSIFSGIWEGIKSIATGVINTISSAVNGVVSGISKVKESIGGVGGKIAKTLHIPGFAKGSKNTPDTFIAGENGPELITNAPGRTVYTAQQTQGILKAQNLAGSTAAAVQAAKVTNITNNNATENVPGVSAPELRSGAGQSSITVTINNNPVINVDGDKPGDLEEKLEENNRRLLQQVKDLLDKRDDDERRSVYA